jgi:diacylglycerol kinase family enzyme
MPRTLVILNAAAGTLRDLGEVDIDRRVADPLEATGRTVEIVMARGRKIGEAIRDAVHSPHEEVVVGGGDGTVNRALDALAGTGKTIGVLPLGTLNLLARDIGMPADLDGAVAALARATPQPIDLGRVNGRIFHSLSGLGFFSQIARAREETQKVPLGRTARFILSAWRAFTRTGRLRFHIEIDGTARTVDTYAFIVTVNAFDAPGWRRSRLDGGRLEVHVAEARPALGRIKAAIDLMTGAWRNNDGIESVLAEKVVVSRARTRTWVSTDGERFRETMPLAYEIVPKAVTVLIPPPQLESEAR